MVNKKLKIALFEREETHGEAAAKMGINARVFTNKINRRMVNGYEARFKSAEKAFLASEYGIDENEIE